MSNLEKELPTCRQFEGIVWEKITGIVDYFTPKVSHNIRIMLQRFPEVWCIEYVSGCCLYTQRFDINEFKFGYVLARIISELITKNVDLKSKGSIARIISTTLGCGEPNVSFRHVGLKPVEIDLDNLLGNIIWEGVKK